MLFLACGFFRLYPFMFHLFHLFCVCTCMSAVRMRLFSHSSLCFHPFWSFNFSIYSLSLLFPFRIECEKNVNIFLRPQTNRKRNFVAKKRRAQWAMCSREWIYCIDDCHSILFFAPLVKNFVIINRNSQFYLSNFENSWVRLCIEYVMNAQHTEKINWIWPMAEMLWKKIRKESERGRTDEYQHTI